MGGPGDDLITGGPACDVFGIDLAIEHRDVISDFQPAVDRVRFPPLSRDAASNRLPSIELGGAEWLEVTFLIEDSPDAVVVFEGIKPGTRLVLSTDPCSKPPPPAAFCPAPGARRSMVFVGFEDLFCPEGGKLSIDAVASESATFSAEKILGDRLTSK